MTKQFGFACVLVPLLLGCSAEPTAGPREIVWDRDTCERCGMIISDRHDAVQVRDSERGHLHAFDDLGCALYWLDERAPGGLDSGPGASEIWARDGLGERWIDAAQARFAEGRETPMGYGFGTATDAEPEMLDLAQVRESLRERKRDRRRADR